ncbi:DNA-protecting protein DprA [Candidatus Saccharibacteria bacterium]|nr:DNA-protecting protein DprA [Candidatus Saccharibacteria bacterium]
MRVNRLKRDDPDFPDILRQIPSPPKDLFWAGTHPNEFLDKPRVAIVGSRKVSGYGRAVTEQLASELARAKVVIISGLALGVDSIAHQSTLNAGGLTIAVLPTSLDQIYPASHLNLARQIVDSGGCLISEYPLKTEAYKTNFIARNRLVSGLADVLLITEAAKNSGTMHTAGFALEQGRTVMAVPGNINSPGSEGCNNLIKSGALPATNADDIFFALRIDPKTPKQTKIFRGSDNEQKILGFIRRGMNDTEDLAKAAKLGGPDLSAALTMLEINGYIRAEGGNWTLV